MQNEFEKQVQQKMEELKLVPSEPVWQKVELQIRKKKDRRRVLFWIPLIVFLAGALWFGIDQYPNPLADKNTEHRTRQQKENITPAPADKAVEYNIAPVDKMKPSTPVTGRAQTSPDGPSIKSTPFQSKEKTVKDISFLENTESVSRTRKPVETIMGEQPLQPNERKNFADTGLVIIQKKDTSVASNAAPEIKAATEPVKQDSASVKKPEVKKQALSVWKYNLVAVVGASGLGRINIYDGQKSINSPIYSGGPGSGQTSGGNNNNYGPSDVEKGLSFTVGAAATKQLGKKTSFSAGLQYNYYSNTINVGSTVFQSRVIMDYAVSQFYINQANTKQPYKNQYHFISLPLTLDWQLLKKRPLNLQTGLALQYLVQTNALRFDNSTQTYFHNKDAFNKIQLSYELGFNYSVLLKQRPLAFGPQIQYGLTRLEKGNPDNHVFSYGLKVQWQVNKK